jgi:uncharacterized protein (TIGR02271 family)
MAKTVIALYDERSQAEAAVQDLVDRGYERNKISVVAKDSRTKGPTEEARGMRQVDDKRSEVAGTGAAAGAVLGAIGGLLAEAGLLAVPGLGPVVAVGEVAAVLLGTAAGAGVGGLAGALVGMGITREDAEYYAEGVRRGGILVGVTVEERHVHDTKEVLEEHDPIDIRRRAGEWRQAGWTPSEFMEGPEMEGSKKEPADGTPQVAEEADIEVVEEELDINKRGIETGGVRVRRVIHEEPVKEDVTLRKERVDVERRPADRYVDPDDMETFAETTVEMRETDEEVVVSRDAHVVEEIHLEKTVEERTETVHETVRETEVNIEPVGEPGREEEIDVAKIDYTSCETVYREHFENTYAHAGASWDTYRAAYRYGYDVALNERFRSRDWREIAPEVREAWEEQHPKTWDRFREAIRKGWDCVQVQYQRQRANR